MSTFGFKTWAEVYPQVWNILPAIEIGFKRSTYIAFSWLCFELSFIKE